MVVFWVRYSDSHDLVVGLQYLLDSLLSRSSPSRLQLMIDSSPGLVASILVLSLDQKNRFNIRTLNYFILEIFRNFRSRICKDRTHPFTHTFRFLCCITYRFELFFCKILARINIRNINLLLIITWLLHINRSYHRN